MALSFAALSREGERVAARPAGPLAGWPLSAVLAGVGALAVAGYVLAEARISLHAHVTPLWNWDGFTERVASFSGRGWLAFLAAGCLLAWIGVWWSMVRRADRVSTRGLIATATAWCLPLVAGPPLLSLDVYAYLAQGRMVNVGLNPYHLGPAALGNSPFAAAVDPLWRSAPAPYGPLLLRTQATAVTVAGHHPVLGVFLLRGLVAAALAVAAVLIARSLARSDWRRALVLVALNPVTLIFLLNGAHLDALMASGIVAALAAQRSGRVRLALVLAAAATAFKLPAVVAVAAVAVADLHGRRGGALLRRMAEDAAVVATTLAVASFAVPDGFGWLSALTTPAKVGSGYAPAELTAHAVHGLLAMFGVTSWATELAVVRGLFIAAGAAAVGWLCLTVNRRGVAVTTVLGLLVVAFAAPVLYPWYLAWGLVPAALLADRRWARRLIVAATVVGLGGAMPDLHLLTAGQRHLVAVLIAAPALATVGFWLAQRHKSGASGRLAGWWRGRAPRWSLAGLLAAGGLTLLPAPAVAVPGSILQTAQLLTGDQGIAHAWLVGYDYYVLLPDVPLPEQTSVAPFVIQSDGGAVVQGCPAGPMAAAEQIPADSPGAPVAVYHLGQGACWRPDNASVTG